MDQGIDSSSTDIMAELGESVKEELDGYPTTPSVSQTHLSDPQAVISRSSALQPSVDTMFVAPVKYVSSGHGEEVGWSKETKTGSADRQRFQGSTIDPKLDSGSHIAKRIDSSNVHLTTQSHKDQSRQGKLERLEITTK